VTAGFLRNEQPRLLFGRLNEQSGFGLDPNARVDRLRIADQQKVEILRALVREARLIVMDEPTAALGADDTMRLLEVIRALRAGGATIVYVSHFLSDVLNLVDEVTVLKDGVVVLEGVPAAGQTAETLVTAMIGRQVDTAYREKQPPTGNGMPVLSVRELACGKAFADISFDVAAGEIVGLAGLVGSGRSEVVRAIFGAERLDAGSIVLHGRPVSIRTPRDAVRAGIAMIPESRKDQGLLMGRPVLENVSLPHLDSFSWGPFLQGERERRSVESTSRQVDVRTESLAAPIYRLSGGNQQKTLFARWLLQRPAVLIADEPTRGVDVGAKVAIHELIAALAASGTAVIVISSDFDEVARLAHRALVMRSGRIVAEYRGGEVTEANLVHAAFGTTEEAALKEQGAPT
jgi:ABC-type sugar transport system ATPase subunit